MTKKKKPEDLLPRGRPSDYRPEYCEEIVSYFDRPLFKEGYKKELHDFPTLQEYAARIRCVSMQTLHNWAAAHPEFMEAFNRAKQLQEMLLVQGGLSRAYDGGFTKFILNSVSDTYKDKPTVVDVSDDTKGLIKLAYALPAKKDS